HVSRFTFHSSRFSFLVSRFSFLLLALLLLPIVPYPAALADAPQIDPVFSAYYAAHGGVPVLGLPLANAEVEGGRKVQYTERARLEYHPENAGTAYEVQLGLLGIEQTQGRLFEPLAGSAGLAATTRFFPETGHSLAGAFLDYWTANGGLAQFGFP